MTFYFPVTRVYSTYIYVPSASGESFTPTILEERDCIRHMRVFIEPIRRDGSWGYLTGNSREVISHFI